MSKNTGLVVFSADSTEMWIKYNATVEQCYPKLYADIEDVGDDWYNDDWPVCECGEAAEPVTIYPYDFCVPRSEKTICWPGTACRRCRCLVTGLQDE